MSQVASWSSEAVPSSSGPIRRVTGRLRHWEPRARQGGTVGLDTAPGWTVTAMLYQVERSGRVGRKVTSPHLACSGVMAALPFSHPPLILVLVKAFTKSVTSRFGDGAATMRNSSLVVGAAIVLAACGGGENKGT